MSRKPQRMWIGKGKGGPLARFDCCEGQIEEGEVYLCSPTLERFCIRCIAWALGEMVKQMKQQPKSDGRFESVEPVRLGKNGQPIAPRLCCNRYIDQTHAENCPHRKGA